MRGQVKLLMSQMKELVDSRISKLDLVTCWTRHVQPLQARDQLVFDIPRAALEESLLGSFCISKLDQAKDRVTLGPEA